MFSVVLCAIWHEWIFYLSHTVFISVPHQSSHFPTLHVLFPLYVTNTTSISKKKMKLRLHFASISIFTVPLRAQSGAGSLSKNCFPALKELMALCSPWQVTKRRRACRQTPGKDEKDVHKRPICFALLRLKVCHEFRRGSCEPETLPPAEEQWERLKEEAI